MCWHLVLWVWQLRETGIAVDIRESDGEPGGRVFVCCDCLKQTISELEGK